MKFINYIIFVLCLHNGINCDTNQTIEDGGVFISPKYEYLNFCARMKSSNHLFTVVYAKLKWGKWIPGYGDWSTEVTSPQGKQFGPGIGALFFCSAGRANAASGTEGYVEISPYGKKDILKFEWDVNVSNNIHYEWSVDYSKYYITNDPMWDDSKNRREFYVKVLGKNDNSTCMNY